MQLGIGAAGPSAASAQRLALPLDDLLRERDKQNKSGGSFTWRSNRKPQEPSAAEVRRKKTLGEHEIVESTGPEVLSARGDAPQTTARRSFIPSLSLPLFSARGKPKAAAAPPPYTPNHRPASEQPRVGERKKPVAVPALGGFLSSRGGISSSLGSSTSRGSAASKTARGGSAAGAGSSTARNGSLTGRNNSVSSDEMAKIRALISARENGGGSDTFRERRKSLDESGQMVQRKVELMSEEMAERLEEAQKINELIARKNEERERKAAEEEAVKRAKQATSREMKADEMTLAQQQRGVSIPLTERQDQTDSFSDPPTPRLDGDASPVFGTPRSPDGSDGPTDLGHSSTAATGANRKPMRAVLDDLFAPKSVFEKDRPTFRRRSSAGAPASDEPEHDAAQTFRPIASHNSRGTERATRRFMLLVRMRNQGGQAKPGRGGMVHV